MSTTLWCDVCKVSLSGPLPAKQHNASVKHKTKVRAMELARQVSTDLPVNLPNTGTGGRNQSNLTVTNRLEGFHLDGAASQADGARPDSGGWYTPAASVCSFDRAPGSRLGLRHDQVKQSGSEGGTTSPLATRDSDREIFWSADSGAGRCNLCQLALTSVQHMRQHMAGKKHEKKKMEQGIGSANTAKVLPPAVSMSIGLAHTPEAKTVLNRHWCTVCQKGTDTAIQLSLHMQSPAHLKKLKQKETLDVQGGGGFLNPNDNTYWHTCDVCRKKVNSSSQLEIHMRSHFGIAGSRYNEHGITANPVSVQNLSTYSQKDAGDSSPEVCTQSHAGVAGSGDVLFTTFPAPSNNIQPGFDVGGAHFDKPRRETEEPDLLGIQTLRKTTMSSRQINPVNDELQGDGQELFNSRHWSSPTNNQGLFGWGIDPQLPQTNFLDAAREIWPTTDRSLSSRASEFSFPGETQSYVSGMSPDDIYRNFVDDAEEQPQPVDNPFPGFESFCRDCNMPFNSEDSRQAHLKGKVHAAKIVKKTRNCQINLPPIVKNRRDCEVDKFVRETPRAYQEELFAETIQHDTLLFLPTGM